MSRPTKWFIQCLRIIWVLFILNNELFVFWTSSQSCANSIDKSIKGERERVMIVGDPQMTDDKSYDRNGVIMALSKFYSDLYMKRNFRSLISTMKPDQVFIIGDLMDNGREWNDAFFKKEVRRFNKIFPPSDNLHYMVGNHDIGFENINEETRDRFEGYFNKGSYLYVTYNNYTFVVIDTVSLSSQDTVLREAPLHIIDQSKAYSKKILMTHVPLYRTEDTSCGPHRQKPNTIIPDQYGYQYQNLVAKELSDYLLAQIEPLVVFSGDDHDYCRVQHNDVVEMTVPTFSMSQGLRVPGIMVLDLFENNLQTQLCWLPDQIGLFIRYAYFLVATCLMLFYYHLIHVNKKRTALPITDKELDTSENTSTWISYLASFKNVAIIGISTYIICILFV